MSKFVWIMQSGGPALEIKGVESSLPFLSIERVENGTPASTPVKVVFSGNPPKGNHVGKIVILTNVPSQPKLEIDVVVNVP